jgi:hypothetical protein
MIKRKHNTKTIIDQKEIKHKDYQRSKGNITQRLSMTKGNRTQGLSMMKRKHNTKTINDQKAK